MSGIAGGTIVARNYLPYARVLAAGWERHHPGVALHTLVIDAEPGAVTDPALRILAPAELGIEADELGRMRGIYGITELTTALKPHLIGHLLDAGAEAVLYVDSDTDVHADLHDVVPFAIEYGTVLSPHMLQPAPMDGLSPSESEIGWSGLYNSGFVAVGPAGRPFLDWWAGRLRRDSLLCEPMGMHADQRWLDVVPSYFRHWILRDPGVNVAHWNLHERPIRRAADGTLLAGAGPLRTLHFSGYDPARPDQPGPGGWPQPLRFDVAAEPELEALCRDYGARLEAAGFARSRRAPYGHAISAAGTALGPWERRAYRELVLAAEARGRDLPHPFDAARSAEFEALLADPDAAGLLSEAAKARLVDARIAQPAGPGDEARLGRLWRRGREAVRRLPIGRHGWMPYPLPSDRTRLEYPARVPGA